MVLVANSLTSLNMVVPSLIQFGEYQLRIKAKGSLELFSCACNATLLHCMRLKKALVPPGLSFLCFYLYVVVFFFFFFFFLTHINSKKCFSRANYQTG